MSDIYLNWIIELKSKEIFYFFLRIRFNSSTTGETWPPSPARRSDGSSLPRHHVITRKYVCRTRYFRRPIWGCKFPISLSCHSYIHTIREITYSSHPCLYSALTSPCAYRYKSPDRSTLITCQSNALGSDRCLIDVNLKVFAIREICNHIMYCCKKPIHAILIFIDFLITVFYIIYMCTNIDGLVQERCNCNGITSSLH